MSEVLTASQPICPHPSCRPFYSYLRPLRHHKFIQAHIQTWMDLITGFSNRLRVRIPLLRSYLYDVLITLYLAKSFIQSRMITNGYSARIWRDDHGKLRETMKSLGQAHVRLGTSRIQTVCYADSSLLSGYVNRKRQKSGPVQLVIFRSFTNCRHYEAFYKITCDNKR
jgi:hypothetical protein